jgi:cytochrome c biogenesis protein CcdA
MFKKRVVIIQMANSLQNQPFKSREHVRAEIRRCAWASSVGMVLGFLFVFIGIISDAVNITLALKPTSWYLLAIFAVAAAIVPTLHLVTAKHFLGIETESKKE